MNSEPGEFRLMEINGRFWGSLPLADAAAADFPGMLLDLVLEGSVTPCRPYSTGVYCRLLSRDLQWYEAVLRSDYDSRIVDVPPAGKIVRELAFFLSPRHRFDVQALRDPLPGFIDVGRILSIWPQRLMSLLDEKVFVFRQKKAWRRGEVTAAISAARSILFLCYGNINRSALADVMFRTYGEDSGVSVASAGFHPEADRSADPVMVEIAASFGHDMAGIRSTMVTDQILRDSDVIFVMEKMHHDRLAQMGDHIGDKVYLLGAYKNMAGWGPEIKDPYGHEKEEYEVCYQRVAEAVDVIKGMIALRTSD